MVWIIPIAGFLAIALSSAILIAPKLTRRMIDFFSIGSRIYLAGLFGLTLGIILLFLATRVRLWGYVVTLGLIAAASGLSVFFFALRRTKKILKRIQNQSNLILRLLAIVALAIWALLTYALLPAALVSLFH